MNITALVRSLVSAGATPEIILAAIESQEEDACKRRQSARQRQISYRNKKESLNNNDHVTVTTCDSAVTNSDNSSPLVPPSNGFPNPSFTPPYNPPSSEGGAQDAPSPTPPELKIKKKANRITDNWVLPTEWGRWAMNDEGLSYDEVIRQEDKFRDFWLAKAGKDACKQDWQATWRNWIRRTKEGFK